MTIKTTDEQYQKDLLTTMNAEMSMAFIKRAEEYVKKARDFYEQAMEKKCNALAQKYGFADYKAVLASPDYEIIIKDKSNHLTGVYEYEISMTKILSTKKVVIDVMNTINE